MPKLLIPVEKLFHLLIHYMFQQFLKIKSKLEKVSVLYLETVLKRHFWNKISDFLLKKNISKQYLLFLLKKGIKNKDFGEKNCLKKGTRTKA